LSFSQNGRYAEALKDFQVVVDSFPQSSVADDALLQIALYHLETARDLSAAQAAVDKLLKDYPSSDAAPMGYVIVGRLIVARGRNAADVDAALASFDRVPRLFPTSAAVAAARFFAGDTLRMARRSDEALDRFRRLTLEFPRSVWAARAELAAASSLVAADRAVLALPRLQRIRLQFPNSQEAATALNYNSILYRLYVKKPAGYGFSGRFIGSERFRDVVGVAVDDAGRILLGHKLGVSVFDPKGTFVRMVSSADPSAFFVEGANRIVAVRRDQFVPEGAPATPIGVPVAGKLPREVEEIPAVVTLTGGDRIVVDRKGKAVIRVSPQSKFIGNFLPNLNAGRLARNVLDDVAIIDRDARGIVIADRDGKVTSRIPQRGTGYAFEDPVDVDFDPLGHLYVLDGRSAIYVFGPRNRLLAAFSAPGRDAGALQRPKAFAVDAAGRAYVFDEGPQRIQVYQ
jgi:outer membrane protein assembly factor BamD (BamD/ComL family)